MYWAKHIMVGLGALFAASCATNGGTTAANAPVPPREIAPILTSADAVDTASFARPLEARVTHVALDLSLDFAQKQVAGTATLDIVAAPGAQQIILDSRNLAIASVTDMAGHALPFEIGNGDALRGQPIAIQFGDARRIRITYHSGADAEALQWLTPEQTAGKHHPYLFSQGQSILNRSWIPTQDSPGIRQTWEAVIRAPEPLKVVMSGDRLTPDGVPVGAGWRSYSFRMNHPVAPYLIAIAAGDIAFRPLGARTGVWTEPAMMDRAAAELVDTEAMVEAAERLYGPYRWGRYDVIVLPPSFPYGGMENPTLTFLTPTFIAGDKSLNGLIAHELAHSWSGNLVTNAVWGDSWLNEGVTSYFENRIMEALYGVRRAGQEEALSFAETENALHELGATNDATRLHQPPNSDSDGGSSGITYDKGATFLRTMERLVGRARFDAWLRQWFDNHAFQPATSAMFLADMRQNLIRGDAAMEARLMPQDWIYGTGLPANVARPDPAAFAAVDTASRVYQTAGNIDAAAWRGWTTAERLRFLSNVSETRSADQLATLDQSLHLMDEGNAEVRFAWLNLALANRYQPAVPAAEQFLATIGRRKFVAPLFRTLVDTGDWGRTIATRIYARTRATYHPVTQAGVDRILSSNP